MADIDPQRWLADQDASARAETEFRPRPNGHDPRRPRFVPVRFRNVEFDTAPPDLIKGLFPTDGLIVVWGAPKCGKSFWLYDAAMHIARGQPYRGRRVIKGTVIYIACEGERGLKARTEAYRQTLTADEDPPFYLLATRLDLVADAAQLIADIRATLGDETPNLLVIDTLNRSLAGSENKPEDMTSFVRATDELREALHCSVALIHHCGTDDRRPRGFTGLSAAADAQIAVKRDAANNIACTLEFMKDGVEGEVITSSLRVVEIGVDENGDAITSCIVEAAETDTAAEPHRDNGPIKRLSAKNQIALDTLRKAIGAHGTPAPTHNHIPPGATVVPLDLWRRFYLAGTSVDGQPEDTRRKAWRRSTEALQAVKVVKICDEMVWIP